jgi:hypothetical protein
MYVELKSSSSIDEVRYESGETIKELKKEFSLLGYFFRLYKGFDCSSTKSENCYPSIKQSSSRSFAFRQLNFSIVSYQGGKRKILVPPILSFNHKK